ncbi:hypothetical protein DPMN_007337 [Dreissena polymorpha]|uniref:Uncharacterized protein n=1 Tax=Dreissena polymorpha TaxID=45954 RepID=A0A9D4RYM6_DREPO|nr:hypothetical protein DPMN_007337 [Dreissena polymorpha]
MYIDESSRGRLMYTDKSSGGLPHVTRQVKWRFASCNQTSQVEVCLMYTDKSSRGLPHEHRQVKLRFASCTQTSQVEVCLVYTDKSS